MAVLRPLSAALLAVFSKMADLLRDFSFIADSFRVQVRRHFFTTAFYFRPDIEIFRS